MDTAFRNSSWEGNYIALYHNFKLILLQGCQSNLSYERNLATATEPRLWNLLK